MIEIRVSSDPRYLIVVRAMLAKVCELLEFPEEEQGRIVLAVDEACANIIRHTYHGDTSQSIDISINDCADLLEIVLQDGGPPLDLDQIRSRSLDEIRPGGLGTHFIRTVMNEVTYAHSAGGGNTLRMVKRMQKSAS